MVNYLLIHRHEPGECRRAHAACKAADSRLPDTTLDACADGGHTIWWKVRARSRCEALRLVPEHLRERAHQVPIT